ncbi:MAG: NUDIX domain-containing protein [Desulfosalsimonadaceae bacterium]
MREKRFCHFCGQRLCRKQIEGRSRLFCVKCNIPIYENPVPASCMVTVDAGERLLLVKRSVDPKKGWWCLPGGFMELQETPEDAALRELREETGLKGEIERLLGVAANNSSQYDTVLMVGFLVRSFSGTLIAGDDADDAKWFDGSDLPEIAFDTHRRFIRQYYAA